MDYFIVLKKLFDDHHLRLDVSSLSPDLMAFLFVSLSNESYTGLHMKSVKILLREKGIDAVLKMNDNEIFPEVYRNPSLRQGDKDDVNQIRFVEQAIIRNQIVSDRSLVFPSYSKWGPFNVMIYADCVYTPYYYPDLLRDVGKNILPNEVNDYVLRTYRRELAILNYKDRSTPSTK